MNTEDFVTYEQALGLKKLGFDWEVNHFYEKDGTFKEDDCYGSCNASKIGYYRKEDYADAPTLWEAQKWLRKEKHIWIDINILSEDAWRFDIIDIHLNKIYTMNWTVYKTPEEALSEGITECFKFLDDGLN